METVKYKAQKNTGKVSLQKANDLTAMLVCKQYDPHTGDEIASSVELVQVKPIQDSITAQENQLAEFTAKAEASIAGLRELLADVETVLQS